MLLVEKTRYERVSYESEADLEQAILELQIELFGLKRFYLDIKRKIGAKGRAQNIPDGYLLDLSGQKPRLYVVENELKAHDPLRHIAVQILQFALSFESEPLTVKRILLDALDEAPDAKLACEEYAPANGFRGVDHLLEHLVFDSPFSALVIIDEMPENLQNVLSEKFQFGVEVVELARFANKDGEYAYQFEPFLADVAADLPPAGIGKAPAEANVDPYELDTVVVPAREDGFQRVFLGENRWHEVRIHGTIRPQIKYIAVYQVAPISAITYIAAVKSIQPWKNSDKLVVNFVGDAERIGPIPLVKGGQVKAPQNLRYTTRARLLASKNLDEVWGQSSKGASAAD